MSLNIKFVQTGNFLFKHRSLLPFVIFFPILLYVYLNAVSFYTNSNNWIIFCILVSILGESIRILTLCYVPKGTSGRNTKAQKAKSLNVSGIYSTVRHPLYIGNYFIWIGYILYFYNFELVIIISLLYILYYERIIFAEEKYLIDKFGKDYDKWSKSTPAIIPNFTNYIKPETKFSFKKIIVREYTSISGLITGYCLLFIFHNICNNYLHYNINYIIFTLLLTLVFYIITRYIKKNS